MRQRLLMIIAVLLIVFLATIGWFLGRNKAPKPSAKPDIQHGTVAQVELVELQVEPNSPKVGEDLVFNLSLGDSTKTFSALSMSFNLPFSDEPPFELIENPFTLDQELAAAGWQILINQLTLDEENKLIKAELALGKIAQDEEPAKQNFSSFAQLHLPTKTTVTDGQIVINPSLSKLVTTDGEALPLQMLTENYQITAE